MFPRYAKGDIMNLEQLQRTFFELIRQPLTSNDRLRTRTLEGRSIKALADELITPSARLTSFERLELYSQGYWFRILEAFDRDFRGLRTVVGKPRFERLARGYLTDCPPDSFDLDRLGNRLEAWLTDHPRYAHYRQRVALDMVRLEWAKIEAGNSGEHPRLRATDLAGLGATLGEDPAIALQPHLRLLQLGYPVDELLMRIDESEPDGAPKRRTRARRLRVPRARAVYLAVHRQHSTVYFKSLEPEAFVLLRALQDGSQLSAAIQTCVEGSQASVEHVTRSLQHWFADWAALGWFCHPRADAQRSSKSKQTGQPGRLAA
jgi:putative DNA-binding protein